MRNLHTFSAKELEANEGRLQSASDRENLPESVKRERGIPYYFKPGDTIQIESNPVFKTEGFITTATGQKMELLSLRAYCDRWKEFFFSLALTRRIPLTFAKEGEEKSQLDILEENNEFGKMLLHRQSDLDRADLLDGKTIRCVDRLLLNQPTYNKETNSTDYDHLKVTTFYKWEVVED